MPANLQSFNDEPLPEAVVVDSSFFFEAVIDPLSADSRRTRTREFAKRSPDGGVLVVYSSLVYVEAPQYWRRLLARGALPVPQPSLDPSVDRRSAYRAATELLREFLGKFSSQEVTLTPHLVDVATGLAGFYNLRAIDAFTVALAEITSIPDLVTLDRDFRRVDGLVVWSP